MQTIKVSKPFQIVETDITRPFPETVNRKKFILTFTEHFTKWVEAVAIEKPDANCCLSFFTINYTKTWSTRNHTFRQKKSFSRTSKTELVKELKVKQAMTTAYHLKTNGLTEIFNKTLRNVIYVCNCTN